MDWFVNDSIYPSLLLGIVASLIAAIFSAFAIWVYRRIRHLLREKGIDSELSGYWVVLFSSRYTPKRQALEIYKFKKSSALGHSGVKYRFRYQHFNSIRYKRKPLVGGGIALLKGRQLAGVYGFDEEPMVLGALLLRADDTTKGKHAPRLLGSYYEYDDQLVAQTNKEKYVLYKVSLPFLKKAKFTIGRSCMTGYNEAIDFYLKLDCHEIFDDETNITAVQEKNSAQQGVPADV